VKLPNTLLTFSNTTLAALTDLAAINVLQK
jgi:hypothetical protein